MKYSVPGAALALSLLLHGPLPAQGPAAGSAAAPSHGGNYVFGEITRREGDRLEVRPWSAVKPRRLEGVILPQARFFEQETGHPIDLQVGEMVVVAPARQPQARRSRGLKELQEKGEQQGGLLPAQLVVRFWNVDGEQPSAADQETARVLLRAAVNFLHGRSKVLKVDPERVVVGVVRSVVPMVVWDGKRERAYRLIRGGQFVASRPSDAGELKRERTVFAQSLNPAGVARPFEAVLLVRCPPPRPSALEQRRLILRDRQRSRE